MSDGTDFASRIRERYPEGLTGVLALGGTRTGYILEHNHNKKDPGTIEDLVAYGQFSINRTLEIMGDFFALGGQNLLVTIFSFQSFYERTEEYAEQVAQVSLQLIEGSSLDFYKAESADPYISGIDTLAHFPEAHYANQLRLKFEAFQRQWPYQEGHRKIIYEVAPIPLYSFFRAEEVLGADRRQQLEAHIAKAASLYEVQDLLYAYYSKAVYGTTVPAPHFYLGTNRNGYMKLRSMLPISMLCGGPFRLFYTPYPSLFMTRETLRAMIEDLAFGKRQSTFETDYSGQVTSETLEAEYQRVMKLSSDPNSTVGLTRKSGIISQAGQD